MYIQTTQATVFWPVSYKFITRQVTLTLVELYNTAAPSSWRWTSNTALVRSIRRKLNKSWKPLDILRAGNHDIWIHLCIFYSLQSFISKALVHEVTGKLRPLLYCRCFLSSIPFTATYPELPNIYVTYWNLNWLLPELLRASHYQDDQTLFTQYTDVTWLTCSILGQRRIHTRSGIHIQSGIHTYLLRVESGINMQEDSRNGKQTKWNAHTMWKVGYTRKGNNQSGIHTRCGKWDTHGRGHSQSGIYKGSRKWDTYGVKSEIYIKWDIYEVVYMYTRIGKWNHGVESGMHTE